MAGEWTIRPFAIAVGLQREMSRFTYLNFYGEKVDIPYICFYLEGEGKRILVDTGCSAGSYREEIKKDKRKRHQAGGELFKDVVDHTTFEQMLKQLRLDAGQIDMVIQTHLHWDHIMNVWKVPHARVLVQEKELIGPLPPHCFFQFSYAGPEVYERYHKIKKLEYVNGDQELFPGLKVLFTPGHTPGGMSVQVRTKKGTYTIAGLCTLARNYYLPEALQKKLGYPVIPPGCHTDPIQAYESVLRIKQSCDRVLPPHEPDVAKQKVFGV